MREEGNEGAKKELHALCRGNQRGRGKDMRWPRDRARTEEVEEGIMQ